MLIPANDIVLITKTAIRFRLLGFMEPSLIFRPYNIGRTEVMIISTGIFQVFPRLTIGATLRARGSRRAPKNANLREIAAINEPGQGRGDDHHYARQGQSENEKLLTERRHRTSKSRHRKPLLFFRCLSCPFPALT
jgi:hypothetical protein